MKLESSKKAKNIENIEIFWIQMIFSMWWSKKSTPPNLGFWTHTFTFFQIILATFQKK